SVEVRVVLQAEVKPWSSEFDKGSQMGEINRGSRIVSAELLRGLVGVLSFAFVGVAEIESEVRVLLQTQEVCRGLMVELIENVSEILHVALLDGWTVSSSTDSMVVSSVASSIGQPAKR
ncbi:MAG: hypothetical protein MJE68_15535, partial [Proteobacteria bacterium]|nr:hypothetical protein [Pseudomonadota bacterium]